jgi:hypothetical protein
VCTPPFRKNILIHLQRPLQRWRWGHYISPKHQCLPTSLRDIRSQENSHPYRSENLIFQIFWRLLISVNMEHFIELYTRFFVRVGLSRGSSGGQTDRQTTNPATWWQPRQPRGNTQPRQGLLMKTTLKLAACCVVAPCRLVWVYQRFSGP